MDISKLVNRIKQEFSSSHFELISQIDISDDEYEQLLCYLRNKVKNSSTQTIAPVDAILSVAMVQIAIRAYSEENYWDCFNEEVGIDIPQNKKYYFAQIFAKTIIMIDITRNTFNIGENNLVFYVGASRARFCLSLIVNMSDDECRSVSEILGSTLQGKPPKKMLAASLNALLQ